MDVGADVLGKMGRGYEGDVVSKMFDKLLVVSRELVAIFRVKCA